MTTAITPSGEQTYAKPSAGSVIGGVIAGNIVASATKTPHKIFAPKIMNQLAKINDTLSADQFTLVKDAVGNTLKQSGLDKKGVEILRATSENVDEVAKIMTKEFNGNFMTRHLPDGIKDFLGSIMGNTVADGKNAFYAMQSKKVVLPDKGLALTAFHELGHAANANLSKFGKTLQKCRPLTALALPIALIALFKTKKQEGQESKGAVDKATTFVKNNAGKLTFAAFLPMLLEEGLATAKGNAFAKKLLSPDLAKKVSKTNALAYTTYLGLAVLSSLGIYLGVKLKDSITDKSIKKRTAAATEANA